MLSSRNRVSRRRSRPTLAEREERAWRLAGDALDQLRGDPEAIRAFIGAVARIAKDIVDGD
jgi:truncated hemoglobin YjbI